MLQACLAVPDVRTGRVQATCRILGPDRAAAFRFPSERNFNFSALAPLRARLLEVDAVVIEPETRPERAFAELGERLARFLIAERLDFVFTTVRIGIADGGHTAASMHHAAAARAAAPDNLHVTPRLALAIDRLTTTLRVPAPAPLRGWLELGAWTCGDPAWNRDPHCAEIPLLLPLSRLRVPSARRFLAVAA